MKKNTNSDFVPTNEQQLAALLGGRMQAARKATGLSIENLAISAGVAGRSYIEWEAGRQLPRLDSLIKVANYHGLTMAQLFADES